MWAFKKMCICGLHKTIKKRHVVPYKNNETVAIDLNTLYPHILKPYGKKRYTGEYETRLLPGFPIPSIK